MYIFKGVLVTGFLVFLFLDEYPKPRIIEQPQSQQSIRGANVTLLCRATSTASARLEFTWKHDNMELYNFDVEVNAESSERGVMEAVSKFYLINVTHSDAGRYQCMVANNYGTTYSTKAKIIVLGKSFSLFSN